MNLGRIERLELAGRIEHLEHAILGRDDVLDLRAKARAIQIAQPHGMRAADLVAIARADAATGRADVLAVGRALVERAIFGKVPGKDHVRPIADPQIVAHRPTPRFASSSSSSITRAGLSTTPPRDHARHARRQDAAGQQRELVGLVADDDRVPGVRAALVADDEVVLAREEIDDLALGFVAPLQTDNASSRHGIRVCAKQKVSFGGKNESESTSTANRPLLSQSVRASSRTLPRL